MPALTFLFAARSRERNDRDRVSARVDCVQRAVIGSNRHGKRCCAGVSGAGQHLGRSASINLAADLVGGGVDHRDLVGVVLRDVEASLRAVERHPERIAVELDARDEMAGGE